MKVVKLVHAQRIIVVILAKNKQTQTYDSICYSKVNRVEHEKNYNHISLHQNICEYVSANAT